MALHQYWQGSLGNMRSLVIQLVCLLGWFSCFAVAKYDISEGVTGSANFPLLGVICVGNLAIFAATLIRGSGLDLAIGAQDVLDSLISRKLYHIHGIEDGRGLTTCRRTWTELSSDLSSASVIILSNGAPNWSVRQFMKSNAPILDSIQLQFLPLRLAAVTVETCQCSCECIVIWTVEEITMMLARRMPGTLKQLCNSRCLLPCLTCLRNGCHGCNEEELLRVESPLPPEQSDEGYRLRQSHSKVVSEVLDQIKIRAREAICICIPMNDARRDGWTKLLIKSLRSRDAEGRGVTVMASEALEGYLAGDRGGKEGNVRYNIFSFIVPRLAEVLINVVLTFWLGVDGFSSAVVARSAIRYYLVDSKETGLAANAFLSEAEVKSDEDNTRVCQVLRFRGNIVCIITYLTGCVNLVASLGWALLISFEGEGGADSSPTPSMAILVVIIAAIGTAVGMDLATFLALLWKNMLEHDIIFFCAVAFIMIICTVTLPVLLSVLLSVYLILKWLWLDDDDDDDDDDSIITIAGEGIIAARSMVTGIAVEMVCIVAGSAVAGTMDIKSFGRWVYAALQLLVWLKWASGKWASGAYLFNSLHNPADETISASMYSSAFLLNGVLAGVRCKWEAWPWKDNPLFSRKEGR